MNARVQDFQESTPNSMLQQMNREDLMKWTACGSGVYSIKSALKKLYQADSKVIWHSLVWEKGFVPKYAFIL